MTIVIAVAGSLFAFAASASAAPKGPDCVAREDVAVLDQYCGKLPGPDGRGATAGPTLREVLPKKVVKRLESAGRLGETLLALTLAAPEPVVASDSAARRQRSAKADDTTADGSLDPEAKPSSNPLGRTVSALTGPGGTSEAFRLGLALSTSALLGAVWVSFRRRPGA